MSKITYAYIGKWEHDLSGSKLGFDVFAYDSLNEELQHLSSSVESNIMVGATWLDKNRGILYCTDEAESLPGMTGGGGRILAFKLVPENGAMQLISAVPACGVRTSSLLVEPGGEFLIATNHAGRRPVTKTCRDVYGKIHITLEYDEANTVLFRLNYNGTIDEAVDVYRHTTGVLQGRTPHPHNVAMSHDGELFGVCDKGSDSVYMFRIDRERGRLILTGDAPYHDLPGCSPRYGVFHPTKELYFINHEAQPIIHAFHYDEAGRLSLVCTQDVLPDGVVLTQNATACKVAESSDIKLSADGKTLYNVVRGLDIVAVFGVAPESGMLTKKQTISISENGESAAARGCVISPDGRFLLLALTGSGKIVSMRITEEGLLDSPRTVADGIINPANITFWETLE